MTGRGVCLSGPSPASATSTRYSSITGLASNFRHISVTDPSASSLLAASTRISMYFPARTLSTPLNPSE